MTVLPSLDVLAAFTAASLVLIFTPGPDMTLFLGETLRRGRACGFAAMLGVASGLLIHTMLAALGLSALLVAGHSSPSRSRASPTSCGSRSRRCATARR